MKGILYGIGVGPGDPELMTLKAVRLIRENEIIAFPGIDAKNTIAYQIAVQAVPELEQKVLLAVDMPMIMDRKKLEEYHESAARQIEDKLKTGKNVLFLTLGDPTVYSTYLYIKKRIEKKGYETKCISGIPSFCAAAASADMALGEGKEQIHIVPARYHVEHPLEESGTYVFMKSGKKIGQVKQMLKDSRRDIVMIENCGMKGEKIYWGADNIPDDAGYYSLIIAKEER